MHGLNNRNSPNTCYILWNSLECSSISKGVIRRKRGKSIQVWSIGNDCWDFSVLSGIPFQEEATSLTRADRFSSSSSSKDGWRKNKNRSLLFILPDSTTNDGLLQNPVHSRYLESTGQLAGR